ncbi:CRISPR-associated protein Cas1 [Lactobacillus colini]|uniref:CRISPR-associated endonuclease Cas1 n=1 Tax=Lactobacillus colini TaxID=1819254 RepID=A0ABS4MGY7_9LACO|nr:type I-C CRISPR-associated endonuclease Cas1c [Lactobacillus colini]MBP2058973.1 CRISPR-associated protein Cas1 [Lactobacillus colini]
MKKINNTLYVTSKNAYLATEGNDVKVIIDKKCAGKVPLQNFEAIVTFGYAGISPGLMQKCLENRISVSFMSETGRLRGRVVGKPYGNVYLRKTQYGASIEPVLALQIASNFILGKIYNQRWIIERLTRDHGMQINVEKFKDVSSKLKLGLDAIESTDSVDKLRGIEGNLATEYFAIFDDMIINQKETFYYHGRNRRPPMDNVNALLSFAYSLLAAECSAALTSNGLDSYVGFMHVDRSGRESLALDLMEELRGVVADRFVLSLINKKMISEKDFEQKADGAVLLSESARKKFLSEWQKNKMKELMHPYLKEKIQWGLVPFIQSQLLARFLRGDIDEYPPFLWK